MPERILVLTLLLLAVPCRAEIIIVDDDGLADFNNIQAAIDDANNGDTVIVADGLYTGPGNHDIDFLGKAITVRSTNPNDPNVVAATIIDCDANASDRHRGFIFQSGEAANSVLAGFTVINGYEILGGAIYCLDGSPTITYCVITGNTAVDGGGIHGGGTTATITRCIIKNNLALRKGGGLDSCDGLITKCIIAENLASFHGFSDGGGLSDCRGTISNCMIANNMSTEIGGGLYSCSGSITNCTIVDNTTTIQGGGMYECNGSITNCIIWGNGPDQLFNSSEPNYSCVEDGSSGTGNIAFYPMFVDANNGNYHLQPGSKCIDAGDPNFSAEPNNLDIDGQPRILGSRVDMGADEFGQLIVVSKPKAGEVWVSGSTHEVGWESYAFEGTVNALFSKDAGGNWQTVESNLPDTGSYVWHLPGSVDSNQCLISVEPNVPDPNVVCINSGLFTIHPDLLHPEVPSKWKSLGGDFKRAGLSENYGPQLGCVKWQFETEAAVSASITVGAGGRVHIACEDGKVYTLDIDNGSLLWSYDTNSPLISAPTVGPRGSVYVGSENGTLYAISIGGTLRWTHSTGGLIYSSPAVSEDGKIYVGSQDGTLYALGQDGSELWTFKIAGSGVIEGSILASPAIAADGTVYIGGLYDPNLYALDPNDGSTKWVCNFASGGWPFASPVVAEDGTIYQTLVYDPNLYAIDQNDGNIIWAADMTDTESGWFEPYYYEHFDPFSCEYEGALYHLGDSGWSEPALGPDGTIYVSLDDPNLRAVDPNGDFKWVTPLGTMGGFTLTVGSDGLIYAGCDDGNLYVVDANGWDVARFDSNDHWLSFPVISEDNIVMVSDSRDNSMLISHPNNVVWAIGGECEGVDLDLYWQGGAQDLDNNGVVDFNDLYILAGDWLRCTDCSNWMVCWPIEVMFLTGDINRDKYVDFADFALLAERWLGGY